MSALHEGLAGIQEEATLFREVTAAPRFAATRISKAGVFLKYGSGGAYVALDYRQEGNRQFGGVACRISW